MPQYFNSVSSFANKFGFFRLSKKTPAARLFSTSILQYQVRFIPRLSNESKVLLPISMPRYDGDKAKRDEYDKDLAALLMHSAQALDAGKIASIDVLSTAGLQELNWSKEKAKEIEEHFMQTHHKILEKHTGVYTWNDFIEKKLGVQTFQENYERIKTASEVGTVWYQLMLKTAENLKMASNIEHSLEYQRREYALILANKNNYTHIAYLGNISLAWSYLYECYDSLPIFTRVVIDKTKKKMSVDTVDANTTINLAVKLIEDILTNENFPKKEKMKLVDISTSLFQAYMPLKLHKEAAFTPSHVNTSNEKTLRLSNKI